MSSKAHNFSDELIAECTEVLAVELEKVEKISRDVLFLRLKERNSANLPASLALDPFKDNLGIVISEGLCKGFKGMRGRGAYIGKDPDYNPNAVKAQPIAIKASQVKIIEKNESKETNFTITLADGKKLENNEISTIDLISDDKIVITPTYSGHGVLSPEQSAPPQPNKEKVAAGTEGVGRMVSVNQIEVQSNNAHVIKANVNIKILSRNFVIEATCLHHVSRLVNQVFQMPKDEENGNVEIAEEKYMCKEEELDLFIRMVENFFKSYLHYMYFPKNMWDHKK